MKSVPVLFICSLSLLLLSNCSTLVSRSSEPLKITISDIESLKVKSSTVFDLQNKLGNPDRTLRFSDKEDMLIFLEHRGTDESPQKASFIIDKATGRLLTATWIPDGSDSLSTLQGALKHFEGAKFLIHNLGPVAHHESSDEAIYDDAKLGVTLRVRKYTQTVSAISFSPESSPAMVQQ